MNENDRNDLENDEQLDSEELDSEHEAEFSSDTDDADAVGDDGDAVGHDGDHDGDPDDDDHDAGEDDGEQEEPLARSVLEYVVRAIVNSPDDVSIASRLNRGRDGRNRTRYEVQVGEGDMGRVIGRRGRTAEAIRTVIRAAAASEGHQVEVEFVD